MILINLKIIFFQKIRKIIINIERSLIGVGIILILFKNSPKFHEPTPRNKKKHYQKNKVSTIRISLNERLKLFLLLLTMKIML
jgi:hypothetical protein